MVFLSMPRKSIVFCALGWMAACSYDVDSLLSKPDASLDTARWDGQAGEGGEPSPESALSGDGPAPESQPFANGDSSHWDAHQQDETLTPDELGPGRADLDDAVPRTNEHEGDSRDDGLDQAWGSDEAQAGECPPRDARTSACAECVEACCSQAAPTCTDYCRGQAQCYAGCDQDTDDKCVARCDVEYLEHDARQKLTACIRSSCRAACK